MNNLLWRMICSFFFYFFRLSALTPTFIIEPFQIRKLLNGLLFPEATVYADGSDFLIIAIVIVCNCICPFLSCRRCSEFRFLTGLLGRFRRSGNKISNECDSQSFYKCIPYTLSAWILAIICMLLSTLSIIMHCKCPKVWE